jgi:hypothetical protein
MVLARNLAATCANCHGTNGNARGDMKPLAGVSADKIIAAGRLPSGNQPATIMHQIAKGYTDEQIKLMARFRGPEAGQEVRGAPHEAHHDNTLSELSRRRLLGAGAALGGLPRWPGRLRHARRVPSGPSIGRVVVVGGGFGGSHRGALPQDVGRQRRRHAGRAQPASCPARSATWCSAATSRWPTSRAATTACGDGREGGAGRGDGHRRRGKKVRLANGGELPTTAWCSRPASTS